MEYGLIGARLGHSFSAQIHKALAPHSEYELCELPEEEDARRFFAQREFCAVNVTSPINSWLWRRATKWTKKPRPSAR